MDFDIADEHRELQRRCLALAADFATRAGEHDRDGSQPIENYRRLADEGFLALNIGKEWGGAGVGLLGHTIAFEALAQGCPSTALAFNMHASVVMPIMLSDEVDRATKQRLADLVIVERKLIAGNFSEPETTGFVNSRPLTARAKRLPDGGYSLSGRKMFASMLEAADCVMVMAYPDGATSPHAAIILLVPRDAAGRSVNPNWDTLGMRATRSDQLILEDCRLPDSAVMYRSDDMRRFRQDYLNWFWASYTAVYLGVAQAAYDEVRRVMQERRPAGAAQPLAYHPDVCRHIAMMSADLEAARLVTYRSAWLSDTQGPTPETIAALYCAKYVVGEAASRITRTALTLGGAHGIFKGSRLEQLFRDAALAPLHPPPSDYCLNQIGIHELGLDPADLTPPLKPFLD